MMDHFRLKEGQATLATACEDISLKLPSVLLELLATTKEV
jgi:hypothetical protein